MARTVTLQQHPGLGVEALGGVRTDPDEVGDQRPATGGPRLDEPRHSWFSGRPAGRRAEQPQRRERVIRDLSRPDEVPQSVEHHLLVTAATGVV